MTILFSVIAYTRQPSYKTCFQRIFQLYDSSKNYWGDLIQTKLGESMEDKIRLTGYDPLSFAYPKSHDKTFNVVTFYKNEIIRVNIRYQCNKIIYTGFSSAIHYYQLQCTMKFPDSVRPSKNFFSVFRDYFYSDTTDLPIDKITPIITNDKNESFAMILQFYYPEWIKETDPKQGGCLNLGNDQYAIYWIFPHPGENNFIPKSVHLQDVLTVDYFSVNYGYNVKDPKASLPYSINNTDVLNTTYFIEPFPDQKMFVPNPFLFNNFTNNCYQKSTPSFDFKSTNIMTPKQKCHFSKKTKVNVYRLDRKTSQFVEGDQFKPGTCLTTYLFSLVTDAKDLNFQKCPEFDVLYPFGYIKMQIPSSVYDGKDTKCELRPKVDVDYWSVSANICAEETDFILPFWTVNAQMLYNLSNDVGYILWAPNHEVKKYMKHPQQSIPPIVTLKNGRRAYLLQTPTFSFIFRYRNTSETWKGNPIYAPCCNTFEETLKRGAITNQMIDGNGVNQAPEVFAINATSVQDLVSKINL